MVAPQRGVERDRSFADELAHAHPACLHDPLTDSGFLLNNWQNYNPRGSSDRTPSAVATHSRP
jgi:hypothetical protein